MNDTTNTINPSFDNKVDMVEVTMNFRKDALGNKRPSVPFKVPRPSVEGVVSILEAGGKQLDLLLESVLATQQAYLRSLVNDLIGNGAEVKQEAIDLASLTWEAIANLPPKERAGSAISKETWDAFVADYLAVMPGATGKELDKVQLAAKIFSQKYASVKSNKDILRKLLEQLDIWFASTKQGEELEAVYTYLNGRAKDLIESDTIVTADAL